VFLASVEGLGWMQTTTATAFEYRNPAVAELAARVGLAVPVTRRLLDAWRGRQARAGG
jgi:ketopantoate reductase